MRTPLAAWRAGVRWPLVLISVVAALVAVVLLCEAIGWPFLVGPVQHQLARLLDRSVVLGNDPAKSSGVRIGLLGSVRVHADSIEIGPPPWNPGRRTLIARDAILKLGYPDLWRAYRGATLHIRDLEAAELEAVLERLDDGRASWQFGKRKDRGDQKEEASLPTFGRLVVGDGHVLYTDRVLPAEIDARFSLSDGSARARASADGVGAAASAPASAAESASAAGAVAASGAAARGIFIRAGGAAGGGPATAESVRLAPGERGFRLKATGRYKQLPVRIDLRTAGVLAFLDDRSDAPAQPLSLRAIVGGTEVAFDGTTRDPLHFTGLTGRFRLAGPSLANVGDALGITLPTTPPFTTHGTLVKDADLWKAVFESASIGSSRLDGAFTYDKRPKMPLLSGRLGGSRLVLADLGPAVGAPPPGAEKATATANRRVIPDRRFDLPSLRAMNANVVVDIGTFDPGTDIIEPLHPARAHLLLADGVLTIADFLGVTAEGRLAGYLQLDARADKALWTADLRLLGVNLARWLRLKRSGNAPPYISGKLDALVKVKGAGRSTAEILGSLGGDVRMHLRDAALSHLAVEAGGIDIAQALGVLVKGDDALPVLCNVGDLDIAQGVATPKVLVVNTRDSTIWIDGTVSLRDETLDLRAVVSPKDFSPMSLRTPIHVKGTFAAPKVSVELGKLAGKAGAAGLLALLHPLAALIPFIDPGAQGDAQRTDAECANLVRTSGVIPGAVRNPASARVPPASSGGASAPTRAASAAKVAVAASAPRR